MVLFKTTVTDAKTNEKYRFDMESENGLHDAIMKVYGIDTKKCTKTTEYTYIRFKRGYRVIKITSNGLGSPTVYDTLAYVYLKAINDKPYTVEPAE